jgi:prolipoprotein diacylglyceryltransferase
LTAKGSDDETGDVLSENILRIADELVRQVDLAKKLVVVMLVALIVGVPVGWHLAGALSGSRDSFMVIGYATILIAIAFVIVGVRQWMVLSKWTERYKAYQELQKKIDAKLDFEGQAGNAG